MVEICQYLMSAVNTKIDWMSSEILFYLKSVHLLMQIILLTAILIYNKEIERLRKERGE